MEDLPDKILRLIAWQVLENEEGMRLWCKLASTCTRLWSFQLPAEPVYFLDNKLNQHGTPCYRHAHGLHQRAITMLLRVSNVHDRSKLFWRCL